MIYLFTLHEPGRMVHSTVDPGEAEFWQAWGYTVRIESLSDAEYIAWRNGGYIGLFVHRL